MNDLREYENKLESEGYKYIGGTDEVGRGPLVGPVVAACCVLGKDFKLDGLTDSKKLTEKKRDLYAAYIKEHNGIDVDINSIGSLYPSISILISFFVFCLKMI